MKKVGLAAALAATVSASAAAQQMPQTYHPKSRDEHIVEALELEWLNHEHDRDVLERVLADDFVHPVSAGIFLTKEQHIDWAVKHPAPAGRTLKFERFDVRMFGDTAVVSGVVLDTDLAGADPRRTIFTDIFEKRENLWRAVNAQETPVTP